jgi:predicted CXXCH cytochrome family protein
MLAVLSALVLSAGAGAAEPAAAPKPRSTNDTLLKQRSVNDNCYGCHADKRGPFLWEHVPVIEDCTACHRPHGSIHPGMLALRGPMFCQLGAHFIHCAATPPFIRTALIRGPSQNAFRRRPSVS